MAQASLPPLLDASIPTWVGGLKLTKCGHTGFHADLRSKVSEVCSWMTRICLITLWEGINLP